MSGNVRLKPICEADLPLLQRVYASTRAEEMRILPWDEAEKAAFLQMQFNAQHQHYQRHYADADFDLIQLEDQAVGRLYVQRKAEEIILIDIALLPEYRQQGIATGLLQALLLEAGNQAKPIRLHVEHDNPARSWYRRLGFRERADRGVYAMMEWLPT